MSPAHLSSFASDAGILSGPQVCSCGFIVSTDVGSLFSSAKIAREWTSPKNGLGFAQTSSRMGRKKDYVLSFEARYTNIHLAYSAAFRKYHINLPDLL